MATRAVITLRRRGQIYPDLELDAGFTNIASCLIRRIHEGAASAAIILFRKPNDFDRPF
jgi:hypothetical protein